MDEWHKGITMNLEKRSHSFALCLSMWMFRYHGDEDSMLTYRAEQINNTTDICSGLQLSYGDYAEGQVNLFFL